jgi:hypothetical protein
MTMKQLVDFSNLKFSQFIDAPIESNQLPSDALKVAKNSIQK